MKKLIVLLIALLLTANLFANIRDYSLIEPHGQVEYGFHHYRDLDWIQYLPFAHFVKDGKLYVISYEPFTDDERPSSMIIKARKLYLYCKNMSNPDNPWVIASDVLFTGNFYSNLTISNGHTSLDMHYLDIELFTRYGCMLTVDGNNVTITTHKIIKVNNSDCTSEPITFHIKLKQ